MKSFLASAAMTLVAAIGLAAEPDKDGFVQLFDGKTFNGWKINEKPDAW